MKHLNASNALPSLLLLLLQISLIFQTPTTTRAQDLNNTFIGLRQCEIDSSNYTSGSQFKSNLVNHLFPTLIANGSRTGFLTATFGNDPDIVYGLVQCRGDISEEDCQNCLNTSSVVIIRTCPNKKTAGLRLIKCLIRYSSLRFFSKLDIDELANTKWVSQNDKPISNPVVYNQQLEGLMTNLISNASSNPSRFMTGSTSTKSDDFSYIYGLVQCTEDLSITDCLTCLRVMFNRGQECCSERKGVRILSLSCQIRYRNNLFFQLSSPPPPPPLLPPPPPAAAAPAPPPLVGKGKSSSSSPNHVAIIVVPIIIGSLLLLSVALCVYLARRRGTTEAASITAGKDLKAEESLKFGLVTLKIATNNFSDDNKLGEGGFAVVYKGELQDGEEIAVKRLTSDSIQGPQQFKNEVALLHKLQHRNLVKLLGYCLEGGETILIYEYVPNRSLDKYLFDPSKRVYLDWGTRYKIIRGIAKGLLYLHEDSRLRIIHRDLKAGNILLDGKMNARVADFGTAKLFGVDQTTGNTSWIGGTFGYMAPEYALHGLFSVKSDVFSFGVLLLEIVSGQKITSFQQSTPPTDLLSYAWKHWSEDTSIEFIDPTLKDNYSRNEVTRSIHIGLLCVQEDTKVRPTMSSVVNMLDNSSALDSPAQPRFFTLKRTDSNDVEREAWKYWSEDTSIEFIDPTLKDNYSRNEVTRSIHIGLLCVQEDTKVRPTMSSVVNMLDNSFALDSPAQPIFFTLKRTDSNDVEREVESDDPSTSSPIRLYHTQ